MTDEYFAGLFDGEGSVGIYQRDCHKKGTLRMWVQASICNTDPRPIRLFKEKYGGTICKRFNKGFGSKPLFELVLVGKKLTPFLKKMESLCVIKKDQIQIALEARNLLEKTIITRNSRGLFNKNIISKEEISKRKELIEKISYAKAKFIN